MSYTPAASSRQVPWTLAPSLPTDILDQTSPVSPALSPSSSGSLTFSLSEEEEEEDRKGSSRMSSFDSQFDSIVRGNTKRSCSTPPTSPVPSPQDITQQTTPVSLPISAPEWVEILGAVPRSGDADGMSAKEEFVRIVKEDSLRIRHLKDIKLLRERNRRATLRNESITAIPNSEGRVAPRGSTSGPLTSQSQIDELQSDSLELWLTHYSIVQNLEGHSDDAKRNALSVHIGLVAALSAPVHPMA